MVAASEAVPRGMPVAVPEAVSMAAPKASPKAVPMPAPKAMPKAAPAAACVAVMTAASLSAFLLSAFLLSAFFPAAPLPAVVAYADAGESRAELPRVVDEAGLFTEAESGSLSREIASIAQDYAFDVVILAVEGTGGADPMGFADDYYFNNGYGYGAGSDGVLFLIAMSTRDWHISTAGYGIYAFTDYGLERIEDEVVPYLSQGRYYDGFRAFLRTSRAYLEAAAAGQPVDVSGARGAGPAADGDGRRGLSGRRSAVTPGSIAIAAAASIGLGLAVAGIFAFSMRSARRQRQANAYIAQDSFRLTERSDIYLYKTVSRVRIQQQSSHGGGGSSTHMGSGGMSHGGRGGKF